MSVCRQNFDLDKVIADSMGRVELSPLTELRILRMLVPPGAHLEFVCERGLHNDSLADSRTLLAPFVK